MSEELSQEPQEEFISSEDIGEEINDDFDREVSDDDVDMDDNNEDKHEQEEEEEDIIIDLANNSWTYFDKHKDSVFVIFKHPTLPMVATGGGDNTALLWTTHTQPPRLVGELSGHKESVIAGGFTNDGKFVITGDMNGFVQVFKSSKAGQRWLKFGEVDEVEEILWISVHARLPIFAFGAPDGSVWVYQIDEESHTLVQLMSGFLHSLECNNGVFIDNGNDEELSLVTVSEDGSIVNWNAFTGEVNYKLQPHDDFKSIESPWVTISVLQNKIAIGARDGQLAIINNDSGKVVHSVKTLENVDDVAELSIEALTWCRSPGINILAVGLVSGDLLLFDTNQWRVRKSIKLDDSFTKLEFVEDTAILAGSSMNGKIYQWDSRTLDEIFVGVGHNMGILDFTILEHGKKLITAGDEGVSLIFQT